jgi:Zn-dependent metalloprotease
VKKAIALTGVTLLVGSALAATAASSAAAPPTPAPPPSEAQAAAHADDIVAARPTDVEAGAGETYSVYRTKVDANGAAHVRYTREYRGLRVYGGDFVVHTKPGGAYDGTSVGLDAPLTLSTTAKVSSAKAEKAAKARFSGEVTGSAAPELFVDASTGTGRLAWETVVSGWAADKQTPSKLHVISDAQTGAFIGEFDDVETVAGTGASVYSGTVAVDTTLSGSTYQMIDPSHGNGRTCDMNNGTSTCTTFTDADNAWGTGATSNRQSAAVDAHFGAATTYDYFKNVPRALRKRLRQRILGRLPDDLRRRLRQHPPARLARRGRPRDGARRDRERGLRRPDLLRRVRRPQRGHQRHLRLDGRVLRQHQRRPG